MEGNLRPSDRVAVVGAIDPDVTAAGAVSTGWVAAKDYEKFMAVVMAGTLGTSATFNAKLEQALDGSGTGVKDITDKAITALTEAGTDESDKQALINLTNEELDVNGGFTHVRLSVTVSVATRYAACLLFGLNPRYYPASYIYASSFASFFA